MFFGVIWLSFFAIDLVLAEVDVTSRFTQQPYDIYLTGDRVCRRCVWRWISLDSRWPVGPDLPPHKRFVELKGPENKLIQVREEEILGVDNHPWWRRRIRRQATQLNGGTILVPDALSPLF